MRNGAGSLTAGIVAVWVLLAWAGAAVQAGDRSAEASALSPYVRVNGIAGSVTVVGSDLLAPVMARLAAEFQRHYPAVTVQVQEADSTAAAAALTQGTTQLATLSRLMDDGEVAKFEARFGYRPTPYAIAVDALVVCVHKDNPIEGLTLDQVDAIFSKTPRYSYRNVTTWGQLFLPGDGAAAPINL